MRRLAGIIAALAFFVACKGAEGPMGPAGPRGADGLTGTAGPGTRIVASGIGTGALISVTLPNAIGAPAFLPIIGCYIGDAAQTTWVEFNTNSTTGNSCGIVVSGGATFGRFSGVPLGSPWQIVVLY